MKYMAKRSETTLTTLKPSREIIYFWKTAEDLAPKLVFAKFDGPRKFQDHPFRKEQGKQLALNLSMVPTFGDKPAVPKGNMQIVQDQSPSYNQISRGQDFLFIFIVDRSGSMGACKRI